jgi:hypothetical protein
MHQGANPILVLNRHKKTHAKTAWAKKGSELPTAVNGLNKEE